MKKLFMLSLLVALSVAAFATDEQTRSCPEKITASTAVSGTPINVANDCGGLIGTFGEVITGSPASASIVIAGCVRGGSPCSTLSTSTSTVSATIKPTIDSIYDYFIVTPTWSGGTNVSFTVNATLTTASGTGSGGGSGGTVTQGTAAGLAGAWPSILTDGTHGPAAVKAASVAPVATDPALVVSISPNSPGTATPTGSAGTPNASVVSVQGVTGGTAQPVTGAFFQATQPVSGTFFQATQPVSATSLPLPTGAATATNQAPPGTAGTANSAVSSIQGIAGMTPVKVDGSGVTQPVSAASLPLPSGAATSANQSAVKAASTQAASTDTSQVVQLNPNQPNLTTPLNVNIAQQGGATKVQDPCQGAAGSVKVINLTASASSITGTSGKQTYICSMNIITGTAQNIAMVEGTGTVCATGIAGMAGGTTAATGWNFAANGGFTIGSGGYWIFATATLADNVCFLLSSTGQTSGAIRYVQQ